jgi:Response regulator containing a CheY-like receiver domain and an HTH DNA-binding domain
MVEPEASEILHRLSGRGEAVFARDASERITFWNKKCEEVFGVPERSALGKHCHDVMCGRDAFGNVHCVHNCRIAFQSREKSDPVHKFPLLVRTKDGWKRVYVKTFAIPSYHPSLSTLVHVLRESKENGSPPRGASGNGEDPAPEPLRPIPAEEEQLTVLTRREREILRLLAQGMTTADIAAALFISPVTVRNHIAALLQRLNVHSRVAAVALAYRSRLR